MLDAYHPQTAWLSSNTEYKGRTWTCKQISYMIIKLNIQMTRSLNIQTHKKKHFKKIQQEYPKLYIIELNVNFSEIYHNSILIF